MKLFSSIFILLLLALSVPGWGNGSKNRDNSNNELTWISPGPQPSIQQGTFLDEQDSNDIDGSEGFIIESSSSVNPFFYLSGTITEILPFIVQQQIDSLLVDLPPPALS